MEIQISDKLEKLIRYMAESDPRAVNRLASKYGYFPASTEEGREGLLIHGIQEEGEDFLKDMAMFHPDKDMILSAHNFIGEDMSYLNVPPIENPYTPRTYNIKEHPMQMYSYGRKYPAYLANADGSLPVQDSSYKAFESSNIDAPFMLRIVIVMALLFAAWNTFK